MQIAKRAENHPEDGFPPAREGQPLPLAQPSIRAT